MIAMFMLMMTFFVVTATTGLHWLGIGIIAGTYRCASSATNCATHDCAITTTHIMTDRRTRAATQRTTQYRTCINCIGTSTGRQQH
jgi:hypothetical protein